MTDGQRDAPSATVPRGRTADEVIQMFAALGLPVCDDPEAIQKKIDAQTRRYQKDKSDPDPKVRLLADIWFKNAADLLHCRADLIEIVYGKFRHQADISLKAAISAGLRELTPALVEDLRAILRDHCRADDDLAQRFLRRYMKENELEVGKAPVKLALVENFTATSNVGKISLRWSMPAQRCDRVLIVRTSEGNDVDKAEFKVDSDSFLDSSVMPGTWYTYRAYSIYQGVMSTGFVEARGVCISEVSKATPIWKNGEVGLTWQSPGSHSSVQIFRSEGTPPSVRVEADGPVPDGAGTVRLYRGAGDRFADNKVKEGATYFYRIIAEFGDGRFSHGVNVQITIPQPPPAVKSIKAAYKRNADQDVVLLEWLPVPGLATPEYVVVRRDGEAPASRVEEGTHIETTTQTRSLDRGVVAGHRYVYAVFTRAGEFYSRSGTAALPVDILAEVSGLTARGTDGTVELGWTTPPNVSDVIVRRSLQPPRDHTDGTVVKLSGAGHAKDERLKNDQRYHYLVCCAYRPVGTAEVFSSGVSIAAVPVLLPDLIPQFVAKAQGREVLCTWTPPQHGQAVVLRAAMPHGLPLGHRLKADEVNRLGERVAAEAARAADAEPDPGKPYYSVFTIAGEHAVVGAIAACVVCPDVTELALTATREGIILRWRWPVGCTLVRVARRQDREPEGPDDSRAVITPCTKADYDSAGGRMVDRIQGGGGGRLHYVVYAQPAGALAAFFSPGLEPTCRETVEWQSVWTTIRYRISPVESKQPKDVAVRLKWTVEECSSNFSGFALLANQDGIPRSLNDGVELFRWTPESNSAVGEHVIDVSLESVRRRRWPRFYAKLLVLDPAQRFTTLVVHPNVCTPISQNGDLQITAAGPIPRRYEHGVPQQAICPWCLSEFPIAEMLFSTFGGGDVLPGKYTLIDRILKRPPSPPINTKGEKLANKICPKCQRELPFTAGAQASLVIGLIGAKYVGKSHYIAALIDRLGKQVGADLDADLLPTSDETAERYQREFYDPLFRNKLELPLTVGTPPPLIYDLRFSGRLWGEAGWRSVTLAFYDTAGENFDKAEKVREMVNYLRFASGVILLVDPLQVQSVRQALPDTVRLPDADAMADPHLVVSRVYTELENGKVVAKNSPLEIPLAVVLTKCDVLRDAGLLDQNRLWASDRRHRGYFDGEAHDDMVGMLGECVRRWSPEVYNTVMQRFPRHAFFGVSSTGCASDKKTLRYRYISPWRVEDPLLWLLAELGVVPSK